MIKEVTMYTVVCDNCGKDSCEGTGYAGWSDKSTALDIACDADFIELNDNHYCPNCYEYDDDDNLQIQRSFKSPTNTTSK